MRWGACSTAGAWGLIVGRGSEAAREWLRNVEAGRIGPRAISKSHRLLTLVSETNVCANPLVDCYVDRNSEKHHIWAHVRS